MEKKINKLKQKKQRQNRVRGRIFGTDKCPRLCVFKSNNFIYLQLIDDEKQKTLLSWSDKKEKGKNKTERAQAAGQALAKKAVEMKIKKIVFDRAGFKFHGRVKAVAEGARAGGLKF